MSSYLLQTDNATTFILDRPPHVCKKACRRCLLINHVSLTLFLFLLGVEEQVQRGQYHHVQKVTDQCVQISVLVPQTSGSSLYVCSCLFSAMCTIKLSAELHLLTEDLQCTLVQLEPQLWRVQVHLHVLTL